MKLFYFEDEILIILICCQETSPGQPKGQIYIYIYIYTQFTRK
jgi:hypothetical protein